MMKKYEVLKQIFISNEIGEIRDIIKINDGSTQGGITALMAYFLLLLK